MTRLTGGRGYLHLLNFFPDHGPGTQFLGDSEFRFEREDPYWSLLRSKWFSYEPEVKAFLDLFVKRKFLFVDCGANIGYWSCYVSGNFDATTVAIEPNPMLISLLKKNIEQNPRTIVIPKALVGGFQQTANLYVDQSGGNSAKGTLVRSLNEGSPAISVPTVRLDDVLKKYFVEGEPVLVKLDIEGLENEVISQSKFFGHPGIIWIFEDHARDLSHSASEPFLHSDCYEVWFLRQPPLKPKRIDSMTDLTKAKRVKHRGYNFVAVPHSFVGLFGA